MNRLEHSVSYPALIAFNVFFGLWDNPNDSDSHLYTGPEVTRHCGNYFALATSCTYQISRSLASRLTAPPDDTIAAGRCL